MACLGYIVQATALEDRTVGAVQLESVESNDLSALASESTQPKVLPEGR